MSNNVSREQALPNANGTARTRPNVYHEAQREFVPMQHEVRIRRGVPDNYIPAPQNLKDFLVTCHTLNQATKVFSDTLQQQDAPCPEYQKKELSQKIRKSPDFVENQAAVWLRLLKDEESSFQQAVFPPADEVHDKFFVVESVDGDEKLCPFDRLGVSAAVLTLVRQVLADPALCKAAGIEDEILYGSAGGNAGLDIPAEPLYQDEEFETGQFRGLSFFCSLNPGSDPPFSFVALEFRPKGFALDSSMIEALENGLVSNGCSSGDASSPAGVITALIAQLLGYMAISKVRHGYLYSVEGIVFLEIQNDPSVVHYFVSLPKEEVDTQVESTVHYSAVSQIFAFVMRAMRSKTESMPCLGQAKPNRLAPWTKSADEIAAWNKHVVAHENVINQISMQLQQWGNPDTPSAHCEEGQEMMDTDASSSGNEFDGESYDECVVDIYEEASMEIGIKMEEDLPVAAATPSGAMQGLTLESEECDENDNKKDGRQEVVHAGDGHDNEMPKAEDDDGRKHGEPIMNPIPRPPQYNLIVPVENEYCTQECLLGIANGTPLDKACPNVHLHGNRHIGKQEFLERLKAQISRAGRPNAYCYPLNQEGGIGITFKVALVGYGYTFVAKATLISNWCFLHREGEMYKLVKDIQGSYVPVCLGMVRVYPELNYDGRHLSHFMALSWSGLPLEGTFEGDETLLRASVLEAYSKLNDAGLRHRDPRLSNMLYNPRLGRVMLIDLHESRNHPVRQALMDAAEVAHKAAKRRARYARGAESESEDEGVPWEFDGSVRLHPKRPPTMDELEDMRRSFENDCREEALYAARLVDWFVSRQQSWRN